MRRRAWLSSAMIVGGALLAPAGTGAFVSDALGRGAGPGLDRGDAVAALGGSAILVAGILFPGRPSSGEWAPI